MIAYHYSNHTFDSFDIAKSDGLWLTSIPPSDCSLLDQIGASGAKFCAKCEITFNDDTAIVNGRNSDVFEQIDNEVGCDAIVNIYEGFKDYALRYNAQIIILDWVAVK